MSLSKEVVIIDYLRSPFSRSRPKDPEKDLLNEYTMSEILGMLWKEIKNSVSTTCFIPRDWS